MSSKTRFRLKMALYGLLLVLAQLLETALFGSLGLVPSLMPVAVAMISLFEGAQRGCIFGLAGGCIAAWSTELSIYGAWCIVILTVIGGLAGLVTERFLLRGIKTALCISAPALALTEGVYVLTSIFIGRLPAMALLDTFLPDVALALAFCLVFYPLTACISRIGGFHG